MATALSPKQGLETAVMRAAAGLPRPAQRLLGGPGAVRIDENVLDPEAQLLLRLLRISRRPEYRTLPVAEAREEIRREAAAASGPPLPIARLRGDRFPAPAASCAPGSTCPRGRPTRAAARVPAWRRLGLGRPRHARSALSLHRARGRRAGARDRLPAGAGTPLPRRGRRRGGGGALRDRRGRAPGRGPGADRRRRRQRGRQPGCGGGPPHALEDGGHPRSSS